MGLEFEVFSLFPGLLQAFAASGLVGRAVERGRVAIHVTDYRDFTHDRHRTVDDAPFGGGPGMVMAPEPVVAALEHVAAARGSLHRVLLTPAAPRFDQRAAIRLATLGRIGLLCGRYEGIDDRVRTHFCDECLSVGDFVLNGGEVAAMAIVEAVARLHEGVLGNPESARADSFAEGPSGALLEHPHFTRPAVFRGLAVPATLTGGNHEAIARWRRLAALARTLEVRPDLRGRRAPAPRCTTLVTDDPSAPELAPVREAWPDLTIAGIEELERLRARARRGHGDAPAPFGLGDPGGDGHQARSLSALAELLRFSRGPEPAPLGPLVAIWPPALAGALGIDIHFSPPAPGAAPSAPPPGGLASKGPIDDISQPAEPAALLGRLQDLP
jgi:tRNA (guanine37-N1)-methyltransferase